MSITAAIGRVGQKMMGQDRFGLLLGGIALTLTQVMLVPGGMNSPKMIALNTALIAAQVVGAKLAASETKDKFFNKAANALGFLGMASAIAPLAPFAGAPSTLAGAAAAQTAVQAVGVGSIWAKAGRVAEKLAPNLKKAVAVGVPMVVGLATAAMTVKQGHDALHAAVPAVKVAFVSTATALGCLAQSSAWAQAHSRTGSKFARAMNWMLKGLTVANGGVAGATVL